jgi:hypothetical protein
MNTDKNKSVFFGIADIQFELAKQRLAESVNVRANWEIVKVKQKYLQLQEEYRCRPFNPMVKKDFRLVTYNDFKENIPKYVQSVVWIETSDFWEDDRITKFYIYYPNNLTNPLILRELEFDIQQMFHWYAPMGISFNIQLIPNWRRKVTNHPIQSMYNYLGWDPAIIIDTNTQ